jgi:uncharacterized protein
MDKDWIDSFRIKLDQHYNWPSVYIFKFIVPKEKVSELKKLFPNHTTLEKASAQGTYVSVTMQVMMSSSDSVIEIYKTASVVEGLIAL